MAGESPSTASVFFPAYYQGKGAAINENKSNQNLIATLLMFASNGAKNYNICIILYLILNFIKFILI